ncbi:MAG: YceI family protein [Actinomycetota bacterium]|nr:YceI family protein [Actinomycetota bacterium]
MSETIETAAPLTRRVGAGELPAAGRYVIDKSHTVVGFVVRHMMIAKVRGQFNEFEGEIVIGEGAADASVSLSIQVQSVDTRDAQRDAHLRTNDFFEAEKFPTITFASTKVDQDGSGWKVTGDLTIKGVTKSVVLDVEFNGAQRDPWGGIRIGYSASTEIDRHDFGVDYNAAIEGGGVVVGAKVKIEIEAEAALQA